MSEKVRRRRALVGWLLGGLLAGLAVLPICDLNFDCGCTWPGLGSTEHCDIHVTGPPDCPWCTDLTVWGLVMLFSYGVALLGTYLAADKLPMLVIVLVTLAWVLLGTMVAGVATSWILDLPILAGL